LDKAEKVVNLAIRRGFFWPAYEIYGGVAGLYVWGPLGVKLKRKVADLWRAMFVEAHDFIEIDSPSIAPHIVFEASGHVEHFKDIMVVCSKCGRRYRGDTLLKEKGIEVSEALKPSDIDELIEKYDIKCPTCGGDFEKSSYFTTMFKTTIGPYKEAIGYLRPETAQGMFVEFARIREITRRRMPIGIAQIGRGFRNEISPRQGPIRLREFDMMELEYFYDPKDEYCPWINEYLDFEINLYHRELILSGKKDVEYETMSIKEALDRGIIKSKCMAYFMALATEFLELLGIPRKYQRFREKLEGERAHYAVQTFDQEVKLTRWGWIEVSGHANRTNYDLSRHIKFSGKDLYAYRKLDKPREIEEIDVVPDPKKIKERFGSRIGFIMSRLSKMDREMIKREILSKGYVEVGDGIVLNRDLFRIDKKMKRVEVEAYIPHVVEPSFGLDRICYSILEYSYKEKEGRIILSLPPYIAPYEVAVFPLIQDNKLIEIAREIWSMLKENGFSVIYDEGESIGRRYARVDEIGVPIAVTVDYQTLEDNTVTVRDRDTWIQYRIDIPKLTEFINKVLEGCSFTSVASEMSLRLYNSTH